MDKGITIEKTDEIAENASPAPAIGRNRFID